MFRLLLPCISTVLLSAPMVFAQSALHSGSESYTVTQSGKHVGDAQVTVSPIRGGFTLESSGQMHADKFSYSFHNNETIDSQLNLVHDDLSGSVHGSKASGNDIQVDTRSSANGRSFDIRIQAGGKQTTNAVDRHRNLVLLPDLDPAAYTIMTQLAMRDPQTAWVIIPKQNGILVPAEYRPLADLQGSLNGQNLSVKHAAIAISAETSVVVELFYTSAGDLLEADLNAQGLRVAQPGFKLFNRPSPVPPPAGQSSSPQGAGEGPAQGPAQGPYQGPAQGQGAQQPQ